MHQKLTRSSRQPLHSYALAFSVRQTGSEIFQLVSKSGARVTMPPVEYALASFSDEYVDSLMAGAPDYNDGVRGSNPKLFLF